MAPPTHQLVSARDLGPRIELAGIGVAVILLGLSLATNFKGVAAFCAGRRDDRPLTRTEGILSHVQPWKATLQLPAQERNEQMLAIWRGFGLIWVAAGAGLILVAALARHVG